METTLAAREDAATILKLYELRQEPVLRKARAWMTGAFWPTSAEEILIVIRDSGSETNCWLRQVISYWEMAAALVNHGVLAPELFVDANTEPFFIAAKFWPHLPEIREQMPNFMVQIEKLMERSTPARHKMEVMQAAARRLMAARQSPPLPEIQCPD